MRRVNVPKVALAVVLAVFGMRLMATSAEAAPLTISFSGEVDLASFGGSGTAAYSGSITWDPAASPIPSEPGGSTYDPLSYTLIFDGVDYTAPVIGDGTGSGVAMVDDDDPLGLGAPMDAFAFFLAFRPPFQVNGVDGDLALIGVLRGPLTMFASTALPADLNFLADVEESFTLWLFEPDEGSDDVLPDVRGTLDVSAPPVPEPASFALISLGLAGVLARTRRARRF